MTLQRMLMKTQFIRRLVVFEDHFKEFKKTLDKEALKKLYQVLTLIMKVEVVPIRFLKVNRGRKGLYEIRSEYEGNIYRVFCCFDEGKLAKNRPHSHSIQMYGH